MPRRIHVPSPLRIGTIELDKIQAHHLRDVLRADVGDPIEAFDDQGSVADAIVETCEPSHVVVQVKRIHVEAFSRWITIASAIPKGDRADWMVEKLSELGVIRFIPLASSRSVVLPKGNGKRERWLRIATESAKQSRRRGVMQIDALTSLDQAIEGYKAWEKHQISKGDNANAICAGFHLSTKPEAMPINSISSLYVNHSSLIFFIGPEGGWTDAEIERFANFGLTGLKLTATILRVETAAIATAAIVASSLISNESAAKKT